MNYRADSFDIEEIVANALKEDIGLKDITTENFISTVKSVKANIITEEDCIICGVSVAAQVFKSINPKIKFKALFSDGEKVKKGKVVAQIYGHAADILTGERVALNFLSFLSAISTKTRRFVEAVKPYKAKIIDTRKTIPGLRLLQKYAVRLGGGFNHRYTLDEMILVKDNHLFIMGGIDNIESLPQNYKTEIEVKSLKEFQKALDLSPDIIMLDNMSVNDMKKAVKLRNKLPNMGKIPQIEASGGVTLKNVKNIASTGVNTISIGSLTHTIDSIDLSLEIL